jgi:type IV pilus assembly protein PilB
MVGEIRDLETAEIAIRAALTGHLVLSTLHTNDATSAIVRMIDMGIEPFLIASSVIMISAQRLVRKLCPLCRTLYQADKQLMGSLGFPSDEKLTFYRANGCNRCRSLGFSGRTVITELFEMTAEMREMIMKEANNEEVRKFACSKGMKTLRESGLAKAKAGITTVEEVLRVTSQEATLPSLRVSSR